MTGYAAEERSLEDAVAFHVHDDLGARRHDLGAPGVDPLRLDLHLPPGAGRLPWDRLGPLPADHHAPLVLEVERSHGVARPLQWRPRAPRASPGAGSRPAGRR